MGSAERNVEVLRAVYEAMSRGDFWAAGRAFDPEIEWEWADEMTGLAGSGPIRGLAAVEAATRDWFSAWDWYRQEAEEFVAAGDDWVVVITRAFGRMKGSTVDVQSRRGEVWTMRNGKAVRFKQYTSPDDALRAVGVEPTHDE